MSTRSFDDLKQEVAAAMAISDPALLFQLADEIQTFGEREGDAVAENARGVANVFLGDHKKALEYCHHALDIYGEIGHTLGIVTVTGNLGSIYKITGDYPTALEYLRRAVDQYGELGNRSAEAAVIGNIGVLYLNTSNYAQALEHFHRALEIQLELDDESSVGLLVGNIGNIYTRTGDVPKALEHYQQALDLHKKSGDRTNEAIVTSNIGSLHASTGDHQLALEFFRHSLDLHTAIGASGAIASVTGSICKSLIATGDIEGARRCLETLDEMQVALPLTRITVHKIRGNIAEVDGDYDAANTAFLEALEEARSFNSRTDEADLHKTLRDLAQKRNDFAAYIEHNNAYQQITDEVHGKEATQKLAMLEAEKRIAAERAETEKHKALLYNTLPPSIADRVLRGEVVNDTIDMAAVLFMDLVGFTTMSSEMDPGDVVTLLSSIFSTCDAIMAKHGLMKIKTIGDSYMAVAFPSSEQQAASVAERAAAAALEMLHSVSQIPLPGGSPEGSPKRSHVSVRIGVHCGAVTAGVIGTERLQYDVWGDTVNVASRMESTGEPGRIHVSSSFALALDPRLQDPRHQDLRQGVEFGSQFPVPCSLVPRGEIEIKGKGPMTTYWLEWAP